MDAPVLRLAGVTAGYGASVILENISLSLPAGRSLALMGRNGVGKSTLMMTLMGHTRLRAGRIEVAGRHVGAMAPFRRVGAGLGWVPQDRRMFGSLTVEENLRIAARPGPWTLEGVYRLFPRMKERRGNLATKLSGGEQQMVAIARALMTNPVLLLLDEPLEGLAPVIVEEVKRCILRIIEDGSLSVVLSEQHALFALSLTDDVVVLDRGQVAHAGPSAALRADGALMEELIGLRRGDSRVPADSRKEQDQ